MQNRTPKNVSKRTIIFLIPYKGHAMTYIWSFLFFTYITFRCCDNGFESFIEREIIEFMVIIVMK